ncbi:restriction endonuclease subunit S [Paraburkholderia phenoliruptrix]|uniref:Restriction endonuclease subunit S n=1 Tax=Paraburkholderia phenoliruptrix TaxID=252970 RepID=A0ABV3WIU8_9BURK
MSSKTKFTSAKEGAMPALVPKLRFPEFRGTEGWTPVTLQNASTPVTERVGERKLTPVSISAGIGFVPQADKFGRDISGNQYQLYTLVSDGDFVYNKGNSLKFPQGCVYQLQGWGQVAAPNVFICFRLKDGYSDVFFQNCFEQNMHGKQLKKHITSGARSNGLLNISKETFFGVEIPTPGSAEQQKIAECLSSVDELIAAQARKVDALKTHKNGLMQQLFPREGKTQPRLRFPEYQKAGHWEKKPFSDLCDIRHGYAFEGKFFSNEGDYVLLTPGNFYEQGGYRDRGQQQKYYIGQIPHDYVLAKGDLLVAMTEQAAGLLGSPILVPESGKFLHNQRLGLVARKPGVAWANEFFFHVFNTQPVRKAIHDTASGAKVRHTSPTKIGAVTISVPTSLSEQKRIASCLSSLDAMITAESQKLQALKIHKKGLMQQLFPSPEEVEA